MTKSISESQVGSWAEAFDHIGARYDAEFTNTDLSRWFRERVWERLAVLFKPGDTPLELGCGTGEGAVWLAQRGLHVLASDGSETMLAETRRKAKDGGLETIVETRLVELAHAAHWGVA